MKDEACVWNLCLHKADDVVRGVTLVFEGKSHTKERVPLCGGHLQEFGRTGRMNLRAEFLFTAEPR